MRPLSIVKEYLPSGENTDFFASGFSPGGDRSEDSGARTGQSRHKRGSGISTWGGVRRAGRWHELTREPLPDCHHSAQLLSAPLRMNPKTDCVAKTVRAVKTSQPSFHSKGQITNPSNQRSRRFDAVNRRHVSCRYLFKLGSLLDR